MRLFFYKVLNKLGIGFYGVINSSLTGFSPVKIKDFNFVEGEKYITYKNFYNIKLEHLTLFKFKINKIIKECQKQFYEKNYRGCSQENLVLAEKLLKATLISTVSQYDDIAENGKASRTYRGMEKHKDFYALLYELSEGNSDV